MARIKYKEAADLEVKSGKPAYGKKPNKEHLQKLYLNESKSIREVAEILKCSKDMVFRALKEYGIKRRPHIWSPKLKKFDQEFIVKMVDEKGYRKASKELGIDKSTLYRYLKKIEE